MTKTKITNADNPDGQYDDSQDTVGYDEAQASPDAFEGEVSSTPQKLIITARLGKSGYEATIPNMPEVKKKTSKVSLEHAARELVKSMKVFAWDDWKDVTSYRDQDANRKVYEYIGEPY